MDEKDFQQVFDACNNVIQRQCSEEDIKSILISLRAFAANSLTLLEFGDFIAHRERNKGKVLDHIFKYRDLIQNWTAPITINMQPVFILSEIEVSLNSTLRRAGLPEFSRLDVQVFVLFVISILQGAELKHKDGSKAKLLVIVSKKLIYLQGQVLMKNGVYMNFPVLITDNICHGAELMPEGLLQAIIKLQFEGKLLHLRITQHRINLKRTFGDTSG